MSEIQQLDVSLTAMDWLSHLQVNKVCTGQDLQTNFTKSSYQKSNSNSTSHHNINELVLQDFPVLVERQADENNILPGDNLDLKSNSLDTNIALLKTIPINPGPSSVLACGSIIQIPSAHSVAQRAEPNRPVDLSAEYKGNDYNKRDGKPPYSYVKNCYFIYFFDFDELHIGRRMCQILQNMYR
jgi:hypothetical protein